MHFADGSFDEAALSRSGCAMAVWGLSRGGSPCQRDFVQTPTASHSPRRAWAAMATSVFVRSSSCFDRSSLSSIPDTLGIRDLPHFLFDKTRLSSGTIRSDRARVVLLPQACSTPTHPNRAGVGTLTIRAGSPHLTACLGLVSANTLAHATPFGARRGRRAQKSDRRAKRHEVP